MPRRDEIAWYVLGAAFAAVGAIFLWMSLVGPALTARAARSWREVPCVIDRCELVSSQHRQHRAGKPSRTTTSWRVDASYRYDIDGVERTGTRFNVGVADREWRASAVARVRAGPSVCWVDPDDPAEALLVRELPPGSWFGLLALLPIAAGALAIRSAVRGRARRLRDAGRYSAGGQ